MPKAVIPQQGRHKLVHAKSKPYKSKPEFLIVEFSARGRKRTDLMMRFDQPSNHTMGAKCLLCTGLVRRKLILSFPYMKLKSFLQKKVLVLKL